MAQVVSFVGYTPSQRFDAIPWTDVQIEESDQAYATVALAEAGTWTLIDTIALSPVDADPADPAARSFTTELASDTPDLWYRVIFLDATLDASQPTIPVQNTSTAVPVLAYADTTELFRILKIRTPTAEQEVAAQRVLDAAAGEIDAELGLTSTLSATWELALAAEVNLERAVEHWQQQEVPFGIIGLGGEGIPMTMARDTWQRHAHKLAPLKQTWGLA